MSLYRRAAKRDAIEPEIVQALRAAGSRGAAVRLSGKACLCRACGLTFSTVSNFDRHRIGKYAIAAPHHGRRCLTADELREKGWRVKPSGGWTPEMPYELVRSATGATIGAGVGMGSGSGRSSRGGPLGRLP